jgi:hypothetical protein
MKASLSAKIARRNNSEPAPKENSFRLSPRRIVPEYGRNVIGNCPLLSKSGSIFVVAVIADFRILDFGRFQQYGVQCLLLPHYIQPKPIASSLSRHGFAAIAAARNHCHTDHI